VREHLKRPGQVEALHPSNTTISTLRMPISLPGYRDGSNDK
jgi:hypothetical protein